MPRDLFGDVTVPSIRLGTRKWYTVPLSLLAHTLALATAVIVPLLATGTLPLPHDEVVFTVTPLKVPEPPPVRRATARKPQPQVNPNAAPVTPPTSITKEPDIDAGFEAATGSDSGVPGGSIDGLEREVEPPPPAAKPAAPQPVRVGGQIREPQKVRHVPPLYPAIAQAARVEGVVIIEATIGTDGHVQNARILRSVALLDAAALEAVRQWSYSPTTLNGVPVPVIMTITVHFTLK
jgi:protein TonB